MTRITSILLAGLGLFTVVACSGGGGGSSSGGGGGGGGGYAANPILFVTQTPVKYDWFTVASLTNNQKPDAQSAYRGGDLYIRYPDGSLKNLTRECGYGVDGMQTGPNAIAVRGPNVHWNGARAVFSMVRGAPTLSGGGPYYWQLYEVTGLGQGDTPAITKVPNQPQTYNNVDPTYASDGRILFASDRPRNGAAHLYPPLDEYNSMRTTSGLWILDPSNGDLQLLNHAPSGAYGPSIDSFGRIVFARFDHLTRNKHNENEVVNNEDLGPFNYDGEEPGSAPTASSEEVFPEANRQWAYWYETHPLYSGPLYGYEDHLVGHYMRRLLPWTMNQDGTQEETMNRIGEHELGDLGNSGGFANYTLNPSHKYDADLQYITHPFVPPTQNQSPVRNAAQIREDPTSPGTYYAVDPRFYTTHASGKIIRWHAPLGLSADQVIVEDRTHPTTANPYAVKPAGHTGFYRNPLPMNDGTLIAVHTDDFRKDEDLPDPIFSAYRFRLVEMVADGNLMRAGNTLTSGIHKQLTILLGAQQYTYDGDLWELEPVEVVARAVPVSPVAQLPGPESQVLASEGVSLVDLQDYLIQNDAGLIVSRNVTTRDESDRQQPFNLQVAGTATMTVGTPSPPYQISHLQVFQGDLLRGYNGINMYAESFGGRRVLAQPQTDVANLNPPGAGGPPGSVAIANDGSIAAIVPARRALTWQLVDPTGEFVVRERYWLTLQAGEVRTCTSCHDPNAFDQAGQLPPTNQPQALRSLLQYLKGQGHL